MPAACNPVSASPRAGAASDGRPGLDTAGTSLAGALRQVCTPYAKRGSSVRHGRRTMPGRPVRLRAGLRNPPGGQRQYAPQEPKTPGIGATSGRASC